LLPQSPAQEKDAAKARNAHSMPNNAYHKHILSVRRCGGAWGFPSRIYVCFGLLSAAGRRSAARRECAMVTPETHAVKQAPAGGAGSIHKGYP
jgi:hypothetical protein